MYSPILDNLGVYVINITFPTDYVSLIDEFQRIQDASSVLVPSQNELNEQQALVLLYAMLCSKPIVVTEPIRFAVGVGRFTKEVIEKRINKILLCNIFLFDEYDANTFLQNSISGQTNYVLTKHEKTLMRAELRQYFRNHA